jgi:hypothetical protein
VDECSGGMTKRTSNNISSFFCEPHFDTTRERRKARPLALSIDDNNNKGKKKI